MLPEHASVHPAAEHLDAIREILDGTRSYW
jgi:hypothetical protein